MMLMLGSLFSAQAQTRDVITFTGGSEDPNYPGVYVIDVGDYVESEDGCTATITLSRPQGATATREASITLNYLYGWDDEGTTVTFQPGETIKDVELGLNYFETSTGSMPTVFGVLRTNHAEAAYQALILKANYTPKEEMDSCYYTTSQEMLQQYLQDDGEGATRELYCFHYGNYMLFRLSFSTLFRVTADSRIVLKTRYTDHTGLPVDADDYGMSKTREVVLTPINVGAVTDDIFFLYKPTDDEMLHSFVVEDNYLPIDNSSQGAEAARYNFYYLSEAGPLEVAKPAEGAVSRVFFSRADLGESYGYNIRTSATEFFPKFSNISINKTSFKSGETMVITAKMDNWHLMKRARLTEFLNGFGVTFDNGETTEPYRFTLDETTGIVTYYATVPTVSQTSTVQVDFGPMEELPINDPDYGFVGYRYQVTTGSEGMFSVTISSQAVTPVPATSVDFVNMPADGSYIHLVRGFSDDIYETTYPLGITTLPAIATNANTVTYSVTNSNGAGAYIGANSSGDPILNTGPYTGIITLTATLANGVSTSRTYNLTTTPARPIHHSNTYIAGTSFPKFHFELNRNWQLDDTYEWNGMATVNDDVTVNYTHANGTTWTEHYQFSKLKSQAKILWLDDYHVAYTDMGYVARLYDLPFTFTDEHPDATIEQIGKPVVSAEVIMYVLNSQGNALQVRSTATLEPCLKDLSFSGYYNADQHFHYKYAPTITSDVMYLPTQGFIVGYEIPELGVTETYDSRSGAPVPDWLELQQDTLYTTAKISAHPNLDKTQNYNLSMYTLAQRTTFPDEVMQRAHSCNVSFSPVTPEGHMVYRVNRQDVTGDLTFDNTQEVTELINTLKNEAFLRAGWYADHYLIYNLITKTQAFFHIYDAVFEGAEVTLTCEGDTLQHLTDYNGCFTFMPPSDEKIYNIEVYYPGYNRRYNNTFSSRSLAGIHRFGYNLTYDNTSYDHDIIYGGVYLSYFSEGVEKTLQIVSPGASSSWGADQYGFIYNDNPTEFFIRNAAAKVRIPFPDEFRQIAVNFVPELKMVSSSVSTNWDADMNYYSYLTENYTEKLGTHLWHTPCVRMRWSELISGSTLVEIVNSQGQPVTDATLNYACVDENMEHPVSMGTATYSSSLNGYQVNTESGQYAELFEVVTDNGNKTQLNTMYLWNYDYASRENRNKQRRYTIVLNDGNESTTASLETLDRDGNLKNGQMNAKIVTTDLMSVDKNEVVDYTQTADHESVIKHVKDGKVGPNSLDCYKYAKMNFLLPYQNSFNTSQVQLVAADTIQLVPASTKHLTQTDFTSFSRNYCLMTFDLEDRIGVGTTVTPALMNGNQTLVELPKLHNHTVDLQLLAEQNDISLPMNTTSLNNVDDEAKANGANLKDSGKAFDKFSFQLPPVFNFSVNIERNGDYFLVRGVYEKNFLPGGQLMEALDKVGDLAYFDEQYQACMDAVNSAKPMDDGFFDDIPRFPSAFVGIKGFVSGIGHINPETGKLEINFYDGGLTFEASARASASVSFGIGSFGMSVDAKIAMTMALINSNAMQGNVGALPTIDFMIDNQFRLKVCAWAQAGIDLWIAKAVVGVRGGACIDVQNRTILGTGSGISKFGTKTTLQAKMEAFAEARILWVKKKKTWNIFNVKKEYLTPNKPSNPFHEANEEPIFSYRRMDVTKGYKKLKRKVIADLGTPIISNISGMARPTYLQGGESLVFNNLKTPSDYNDDRLQLYNNGTKTDLVDTGVDAPMYDFVAAHGKNGMEVVAFEQLSEPIDGEGLEDLDSLGQEKSVSEMNEIHVAWRQGDGQWQQQKIGSLYGSACVQPAVTVSKEQFQSVCAAVIWQQGKAMFNDMGERYIDGSLMLSCFNDNKWEEPIELMRLNQRCVPVDYQMSIKSDGWHMDSVFIAMTLNQDVNNPQKSPTVVYLSVTPQENWKYKTRVTYTRTEGSKPQVVRVLDPKSTYHFDGEDPTIYDASNLVAYMKPKENGRDLVLTTIDMNGKPTGKLTGTLDMGKRTVNDYKLVVDDDARDLDGVALLWTQSDEERTDNGDDTQNVDIKNRLYAAKLCSHDKQLYFSAPVEVATMPDDVSLASMDAYLDGLDMKVAYCVTNEEDGGAVMESNVAFTNAIDHKILFNPYEVNDEKQVPVTVTVANNGFQPIESIEVQLGDSTFVREVNLMPQETADVRAYYPVPDDFDGTIPYNVTAQFVLPNSNSLKMRRLAAARPRRIQQTGTQTDVRQVDMATKLLKKSTDQNDVMTVVAEVNNASLLPLANNTKCKVGLYASPLATEPAPGTTEVTVNYSDLYDTSTKKNKVKIVSLTCDGEISRTLFLRTTPINGSTILNDVRPMNNVVPVTIAGKHPLGDANGDGKVSIADVTATVNYMNGGSGANFVKKAVDIDGNGSITNVDVQSVVELLLKQ